MKLSKRSLHQALTVVLLLVGLTVIPAIAVADDDSDEMSVNDSNQSTYVDAIERIEAAMNQTETPRAATEQADDEAQEVRPQRPFMVGDQSYPHWMWIIGRNAVWGGMIGALVGVGAYLVTGMEYSPWIITQFAGGGILVGAATGVVEAAFWSDAYSLFGGDKPSSLRWSERGMPGTYEILLLRVEF